MKIYSRSLVIALLISLPVAGNCSVAAHGVEAMPSEAKPAMGKDVANGVSGKVVEAITAGDYTYVNLEKDGKRVWAAFQPMQVAVGQEISSLSCMPMMGFQSKALNRTFDMIMFCNNILTPAEAELMKMKSSGSNVAVPVATEKIVIDKAKGENVYTVAQCFEQRADLNKKPVTVRGKVMKVSTGIMGRNWIHLQDGTGDAAKKTNDLVVTSKELAKVGETITVSGTLAKDRDFGAGYKYSVIVELATIKR